MKEKTHSLAVALDPDAIANSVIFLKFVLVCEKMMSYGSLPTPPVYCCTHQGAQRKKRRREKERLYCWRPLQSRV